MSQVQDLRSKISLEQVPVGIAHLTLEGKFEIVNQKWTELFRE